MIGQDSLTGVIILLVAMSIALLVGLVFHEFSHAIVANSLGDPTPRVTGRLSLNPLRHLDPFGTLLMLTAGFGWAKPVMVDPNRLRNGPVVGMATVAVAGPLSNFVMAVLFALPLLLGLVDARFPRTFEQFTFSNYLALVFFYVVLINVTLGVFNLIPLAPLDGSKVAQILLPGEAGRFFRQIEPYGIGILIVLLMVPWITGGRIDPIGWILDPVQRWVVNLLL